MSLVINSSYSTCEISTFKPQPNFTHQFGEFDSEYIGPRVQIDQQEAFNEVGLGDFKNLSKEVTLQARQTAFNGIINRVQEGNRYAEDSGRVDTTAEIAKVRGFSNIPEINVAIKPSTAPKIEFIYSMDLRYKQGGVSTQFKTWAPKIEWDIGDVSVSYQKGSKLDLKG